MTPLTVLILLILGWSALAFGAVYPWAYVPLCVACATAGAIGWSRRARPRNRPVAVASVFLAAVVLAQLVPLPNRTLEKFSPATVAFVDRYDVTTLASRSAVLSSLLGLETHGSETAVHPISINPSDTAAALVGLLAFIVFLVGTASALTGREIRPLVVGVIGLGFALGLIAIVQRTAAPRGLIYGLWQPYRSGGEVFGPFVNRNHFAGWMLMAVPLALSDVWLHVQRNDGSAGSSWRERILRLSSADGSRSILVSLAVFTMALSLVLTVSRSGILCFAIGLGLMGWFVVRTQSKGSRRSAVIGYLLCLGIASIGWAGLDVFARRMSEIVPESTGRVAIWSDTLRIVQDFPLTGTGLNTFDTAMLKYETLLGKYAQDAHNDYLELVSDGGLLVGIPVLLLLGVLILQATRRLSDDASTRGTVYRTRVGAVVGLVAIGLQETVEFSLQIPANAALFTVLCAIAVADPKAAGANVIRSEKGAQQTYPRLEAFLVMASLLVAVGSGVVAYNAYGPYGVKGSQVHVERVVDSDTRTEGRILTELSYDVEGNGSIDRWIYLDGSRVVRLEVDEDGDAAIDRWEYYDAHEWRTEVALSSERDGRQDIWQFYGADGQIERIEYGDVNTFKVVRIEYFKEGKLVSASPLLDAEGNH